MKLSTIKMEIAMANNCITVNQIAEGSGLDRQVVTAVIRGKRNPKPVTIGKIARAIGVNVTDIIEEMEA